MNHSIVTSNTWLILSLLTLFFSCNGQVLMDDTNKQSSKPHSAIAQGKTVSELGKSIVVIFQDQKNIFWFGSKGDGVYKYDRKKFVLFSMQDGLCSNSILGIQEDQFGNIYFDTPTGVSKFDGQKFTTLEIIESPSAKNEWQLNPDDLWFRMGWDKNGPYRYDGQSLYPLEFPKTDQEDEFYSKYPNSSYNPYGIYTLYKDRQGSLWFGTAALGLCRYDGKSISWLYEKQLTETPSGGDFGIRSIIEDREGYFWFCNSRYRYKLLPDSLETNKIKHLNYKRKNGLGQSKANNKTHFPYFSSIAEDKEGDLWMATYDNGIYRNNGTALLHYPIQNGDTDVLLFSIYKDQQGVLWLGTQNAGVYRFNGNAFEQFKG